MGSRRALSRGRLAPTSKATKKASTSATNSDFKMGSKKGGTLALMMALRMGSAKYSRIVGKLAST